MDMYSYYDVKRASSPIRPVCIYKSVLMLRSDFIKSYKLARSGYEETPNLGIYGIFLVSKKTYA